MTVKHTDPAKRGKSARARGHAYECHTVNLLKIYDYEATSARQSSPLMDALGVDIITTAPFNIQCKYVERLVPGAHDILKAMPQVRGKVNVIFHKRAGKGSVVIMSDTDFADLLLYQAHGQ